MARLSSLIVALFGAVLVPLASWAADCPVGQNGYTPAGWPSSSVTYSGGNWTATNDTTRCGVTGNATWTISGTYSSLAAAEAAMQTAVGASWPLKTQCYIDLGTAVGYGYVFESTANSANHKVGRITTPKIAGTCNYVGTADCAAMANKKVLAQASDVGESFTPSDTPCLAGCAAFKLSTQPYHRLGPVGHRDFIIAYQMTGMSCTVQPSQATPTTDLPVDKGPFKDTPQAAPGCGFYNGEYMCMKSLDPDKCWVGNSGARVCADNAPHPPQPYNNTGQPATPDHEQDVCTGANSCSSYNYYNSTTVGASNPPVNNSGDPPNQGGTGTVGTGPGSDPNGTDAGTCTGDNCETNGGTGAASGVCATPPTCSSDDAVQCAQLKQQWHTMCPEEKTEAEILDAIGATAAEKGEEAGPNDGEFDSEGAFSSIPGGGSSSCPAPLNISVHGHTLSLDVWHGACQAVLWFKPILLAVAYLVSAAILFKGGMN